MVTFRLTVREPPHIQKMDMEQARREIEERPRQDLLFDLGPHKKAEAI